MFHDSQVVERIMSKLYEPPEDPSSECNEDCGECQFMEQNGYCQREGR